MLDLVDREEPGKWERWPSPLDANQEPKHRSSVGFSMWRVGLPDRECVVGLKGPVRMEQAARIA